MRGPGRARSFVAIAEWAADADTATLAGVGAVTTVPSESTFLRTLQSLDADALLGAWGQTRTTAPACTRRRIAVDGKTVRGSGAAIDTGTGRRTSRHLLAAFDHAHGVVLGQVDVEAKRGHGRDEWRTLNVTTLAGNRELGFPHAAQAIRIVRRRKPLDAKRWSTQTVYAITSLDPTQITPTDLAHILRGHWSIENQLHWGATWTTTKTDHRSAPPPAHRSWPRCATSHWPRYA